MITAAKMEAPSGASLVDSTAFIHPLAFVDGATVGARSRIWQFASVVRGAVLGCECSVASGVTIDGAIFGDRCVVSQGVTTAPGLVCENDVFLGPNVSICNDRWPVVDKAGFDLAFYGRSHPAVLIRNGASIGARVVILPGVEIGSLAMVAAGSVVTRHLPELCLWTREGRIVPIDPAQCFPRMRAAC